MLGLRITRLKFVHVEDCDHLFAILLAFDEHVLALIGAFAEDCLHLDAGQLA